MNRLRAVRNEVQIETVHIERSDRSAEHSDIHQHLVKGLVGGEIVPFVTVNSATGDYHG